MSKIVLDYESVPNPKLLLIYISLWPDFVLSISFCVHTHNNPGLGMNNMN
jgi:hypothetical protein